MICAILQMSLGNLSDVTGEAARVQLHCLQASLSQAIRPTVLGSMIVVVIFFPQISFNVLSHST